MANGVDATNLPALATATHFLVNEVSEGIEDTGQLSTQNAATLLLSQGPIAEAVAALDGRIDDVVSFAAAGIRWTTQRIEARSTGNVNLASGLVNGAALNGVIVQTGKFYFLGSQTDPKENGIYPGVASGASTRASFADAAAELAHIGFVIQGGTLGVGERWTLPLDTASINLGVTALSFAQTGVEPGYASEVAAARFGEASLADAQAIQDRALEEISGRSNGVVDRDGMFVVHFDGAVALQVDKKTGETYIAANEQPSLVATIRAGDVYVTRHTKPRQNALKKQVRITYSGDAKAVRISDGNVIITFDDGTTFWSETETLWGLSSDRSLLTSLGSGVLALYGLGGSGQSVSMGGVDATVVTSTPPDTDGSRVTMFNGGVRVLDGYLPESSIQDYDWTIGDDERMMYVPWAAYARLVPLVETAIGNSWGETPAAGAGLQFKNRCAASKAVVLSRHGIGATFYDPYLKKGSPPYANFLNAVRRSKVIADILGISYTCLGMDWIHGEGDQGVNTARATYAGYLTQLQADLDTDVKAITGQSLDVILFVSQSSSWTCTTPPRTTSDVPLGMLDAAIASAGKIILTGPRYPLVHTAEGVHLVAASSKILGEYIGRLAAARANGTTPDAPLYITAAAAVGTTLTATFSRSNLAFLTSLVSDPGQNGFRVLVDSGTTPTLSSPIISGNQVSWTMNATLTSGQNPRLGVADIGTSGAKAGPTTGPRCTLASQSADLAYDGTTNLHFFACHQQAPIAA